MNSTITHAAIAGALMLIATPFMDTIPKKIESVLGYMLPVYSDIKAIRLGNDYQGNPRFQISARKLRECVPISEDSYAVVKGVDVEILLVHEDYENPLHDRPLGVSDFGIWKYRSGGLQDAESVYTVRRNKCGMLWRTRTVFGPFKIKHTPGAS